MTNFKQYFRSHLKSNIKPIIFILSTVLILTFIIGFLEQPNIRKGEIVGFHSTLYAPVTFLCILAYLLPIFEFSFFKKRINLDCAYSLPISRRTMGTVHYLTGLIMLFGTFTASYLLNFILLLSRGSGWFDFSSMIPHYFLCLLLGFAIYSLMAFVFNEANTIIDGIIFIAAYTFVFCFVLVAICALIDIGILNLGVAYSYVPWGAIDMMTTRYQYIVEKETIPVNILESDYTAGLIFWAILGIASAVGLFLTFGKRRMEKTEDISDSWFGFRTLIPIYSISAVILSYGNVIFWIIIELLALLLYTVYRRGFHYKLSDLIILGILPIFLGV